MLIILKKNSAPEKTADLITLLAGKNISVKQTDNILILSGDTWAADTSIISSFDIVEKVQRISSPYRLADRSAHPEDTVFSVGGVSIGGGSFTVIAGPCTIESEKMLSDIANEVIRSGAHILRGGIFKPRSSPYSFQGLGEEAARYLINKKKKHNVPVITEIMDPRQLPLLAEADILQVGSRNMQNFELLKELGGSGKPVMLKRGYSATLTDLLMSAEYIMYCGNSRIILCERGIRTFETASRNTLDISAVPLLKEMTHLPVFIDPSHATGKRSLVTPMSLAAAAAGADGIMVEVHTNPQEALCDGPQALTPADFDFARQTLSISKTWDYKGDGGFLPTKNKSSVRKIQIDWQIVVKFSELVKKLPEDKPIFVGEEKVYNSTVNDVLTRHCKACGISEISVHGLRHTHASLLLFAGVSIASVARRLGHASMTTTQKTYLHIIQELENKDVDLVMRTLSGL